MSFGTQDLPTSCLTKTLGGGLVRFQFIFLTTFLFRTHLNTLHSFSWEKPGNPSQAAGFFTPTTEKIIKFHPKVQILRGALAWGTSLAILFLL
jgi:hypothetical protein